MIVQTEERTVTSDQNGYIWLSGYKLTERVILAVNVLTTNARWPHAVATNRHDQGDVWVVKLCAGQGGGFGGEGALTVKLRIRYIELPH